MSDAFPAYRLNAATAMHRGDRPYQQDQVTLIQHPRNAACLLGILADGMGGKSGGRKAADQVMLTGHQMMDRFSPEQDDAIEALSQAGRDAHSMIKLTAITSEQEPHSTLAAFLLLPRLRAFRAHCGDSRVYHFRDGDIVSRTKDHSYVQRLVDEGKITDQEAANHPKSNLLTGSLGTPQEPPVTAGGIENVQIGDALMVCSDGLWHYFEAQEMAQLVRDLAPREAAKTLVDRARERASGGGDNLSLALVRIDPVA